MEIYCSDELADDDYEDEEETMTPEEQGKLTLLLHRICGISAHMVSCF